MRKVWRLSIVAQHKHIIDLHIDQVVTDKDSKVSQTHQTPGGAFDSIVLQVLRLKTKNELYTTISNLYKRQYTFNSDAQRVYKKYFEEAKNKRPELFI